MRLAFLFLRCLPHSCPTLKGKEREATVRWGLVFFFICILDFFSEPLQKGVSFVTNFLSDFRGRRAGTLRFHVAQCLRLVNSGEKTRYGSPRKDRREFLGKLFKYAVFTDGSH